jgi:hypothetical protein
MLPKDLRFIVRELGEFSRQKRIQIEAVDVGTDVRCADICPTLSNDSFWKFVVA